MRAECPFCNTASLESRRTYKVRGQHATEDAECTKCGQHVRVPMTPRLRGIAATATSAEVGPYAYVSRVNGRVVDA